ncbi:MAG: YggS family pyridoxal phosphate enzyme, partial [Candidatus Nitrotoga sp.]|nr:YggS family pyridoxal phosphate enzyme [Candidatus Nitrotoga sp.]
MTAITSNLQAVNHAISQVVCMAHRRKESIELLAVSKGFSAVAVREAYQAGQRAFGESYIQ